MKYVCNDCWAVLKDETLWGRYRIWYHKLMGHEVAVDDTPKERTMRDISPQEKYAFRHDVTPEEIRSQHRAYPPTAMVGDGDDGLDLVNQAMAAGALVASMQESEYPPFQARLRSQPIDSVQGLPISELPYTQPQYDVNAPDPSQNYSVGADPAAQDPVIDTPSYDSNPAGGDSIGSTDFEGSLEEFQSAVVKTHGDRIHAVEYLAAIEMIKKHAELWPPAVEAKTEVTK